MSAAAKRTRPRRTQDKRAGQALVEFALVVPLLLILILGVVEFGRAWNVYQVMTDAAREAARSAAVDNPLITEDSIRAVVQNALTRAGVDPTDAVTDLTGVGGARGTPATVSIRYPYDFVFLRPFTGWVDAAGLVTLKTTFSMRNE
ncbi:MAG: TadE/TadG family type IV pilus assembly protein [Gemmatimonadota bacterium]|jgi:Flp pilus assembly protein TadG